MNFIITSIFDNYSEVKAFKWFLDLMMLMTKETMDRKWAVWEIHLKVFKH